MLAMRRGGPDQHPGRDLGRPPCSQSDRRPHLDLEALRQSADVVHCLVASLGHGVIWPRLSSQIAHSGALTPPSLRHGVPP